MQIQKSSNVGFQARLAIDPKSVNAKRLANVSKILEAKTAKTFPKEVCSLHDNGEFYVENLQRDYWDLYVGDFSKEGLSELFSLTDNQIAEKIKKMLNILKKQEIRSKEYGKVDLKLERLGIDTDKMFDEFYKANQEAAQNEFWADKILQHFTMR